jgi:hypothetical protein
LGERYPAAPGTETPASESSVAETPVAETRAATESESSAAADETATTGDTEDVTPANDNFLDQLEATAEPLTSAPPATLPLSAEAKSELGTGPQLPVGETTAPGRSTLENATTPPRSATTETTAPESETDPSKLLATFLEPPLENSLPGTPLGLAAAVDNSLSRAEQTQRVLAYWELSQAVTNYYLTYKERTELAALANGITLPSPDWEIARQTTSARLELARERVRVSQEHLALLMANSTVGFMPLPNDVPFCGLYETRYAEIFQGRPSMFAQQLNELLPRAHQDLTTRAQEIAAARQWMFKVSDTRSPQTDGNELLKAYELFAARRRMFIEAVKQYNLGIVRYTEIATPGTLDTERLVAMLIRTGASQGRTFDADVQKANAEEGINSNDSSSLQSSEPGVTGWQPAPTNSRERSILVPRS